MPDDHFWHALDTLIESSEIIIDRPKNSQHPRYPEVLYPLDYGCLKDCFLSLFLIDFCYTTKFKV